MLVCHCNVVSDKEIEAVVTELLQSDPWQIIVPAKVFRALEKRGKCCACLPNVVDLIVRVTEDYHRGLHTPAEKLRDIHARLAVLDNRIERKTHARRRQGHRTAQPGSVSRTGGGQPVLGALPAS